MITITLKDGTVLKATSAMEEYNPDWADYGIDNKINTTEYVNKLFMNIMITDECGLELTDLINKLTPDAMSVMTIANENGVSYIITGYNKVAYIRREVDTNKVITSVRLVQVSTESPQV